MRFTSIPGAAGGVSPEARTSGPRADEADRTNWTMRQDGGASRPPRRPPRCKGAEPATQTGRTLAKTPYPKLFNLQLLEPYLLKNAPGPVRPGGLAQHPRQRIRTGSVLASMYPYSQTESAMKCSKPGPRRIAKDAEKTVCPHPRHEGLTVAEASRKYILPSIKEREAPPRRKSAPIRDSREGAIRTIAGSPEK